MTFIFPESGQLSAPAKINLHLRVTGILPDGRHELDTSFAFVDACDILHIQASNKLTVDCSIPALTGEKNLVFQTLQALQQKYNITQGLKIYIDKYLPAQAGLGGGSSDAATALMAANQLWNLQLTKQQLIEFSTPFGADIPCFLFGQASLAKGVGEQLVPYPENLPSSYICLARPEHGLSTQAVFEHYDKYFNKQRHPQSPLTLPIAADTIRAASQGNIPIGENTLEKSAIALLSEVDSLLQIMRKKADLAWMSGSGSTCIALCSSREDSTWLAKDLQTSGLASWTHAGKLLYNHPVFAENIGA